MSNHPDNNKLNSNQKKRKAPDSPDKPAIKTSLGSTVPFGTPSNQGGSTNLNGHVRVTSNAPKQQQSKEKSNQNQGHSFSSTRSTEQQNQFISTLELFADNFCDCQNTTCKKELNETFRKNMGKTLSQQLVSQFTHIFMGSAKSQNVGKHIYFFLQYMEEQPIEKDNIDDILQMFIVLYLKSNDKVKQTLIHDLENVFSLCKNNETKFFVEKRFQYKLMFYNISQFRHCLAETKEGEAQCSILKTTNDTVKRSKFTGQSSNLISNKCEVHGQPKDVLVINLDSQKTFVQFLCFLATLSFKIFHIASSHLMTERDKQRGSKFLCNILFMFLSHCDHEFQYYPLRALNEFFPGEQTEKALSKRLNAESLLQYKVEKQVFCRDRMLLDIGKKKNQGSKDVSRTEAYNFLNQDILQNMREMISKLKCNEYPDSCILCLQILAKLLDNSKLEPQAKQSGPNIDVVGLYVDCLVNISQHVGSLPEHAKEIYYSQVKNLIKIIKLNHERFLYDRERSRQEKRALKVKLKNCNISGDIDMKDQSSDSSSDDDEAKQDSSKTQSLHRQTYHNINGQFVPQSDFMSRQNSSDRWAQKQASIDKTRYYPNLQVLTHLLTVPAIQMHPKLSLLVYEALQPYMEIFDNQYVSFTHQCVQKEIIQPLENTLKSAQATPEAMTSASKKTLQKQNDKSEQARKKVKIQERGGLGREGILSYYTNDYKSSLLKQATDQAKDLEAQTEGLSTNNVISEQKKKEINLVIRKLVKKRKQLSKQEIMFIIDLLISLCKHAQVSEKNSLSLGAHLLTDFKKNTQAKLATMIDNAEREKDSELLMVVFELRSKVFVNKIASEVVKRQELNLGNSVDPSKDSELDDPLFAQLFAQVFSQIIKKQEESQKNRDEGNMQKYTTHFLKNVIKSLQQGRRFLNLGAFKSVIDDMVTGDRLLVVTQTLPLYLLTQMFFDGNLDDKSIISTSKQVFDLIKQHYMTLKNDHANVVRPLLQFYQLRNLIQIYTSILSYFLCFQTPLKHKSSSSQLYIAQNSQKVAGNNTQYVVSSGTHSPRSTDMNISQNGLEPNQLHSNSYESSYVIRRQKRCNWCGQLLQNINKFSFAQTCKSCALKNSTLILPARFLCNLCLDVNQTHIQQSTKDQIPLEHIHNSTDHQSSEQLIRCVQTAINQTLDLILDAWSEEDEGRQAGFFFSSYDSRATDPSSQSRQITSCLSKVTDLQYLHGHLLTFLTCRMLKVLRLMLDHNIEPDAELINTFKRIERRAAVDPSSQEATMANTAEQEAIPPLGDAYRLLVDRVQDISHTLKQQQNQTLEKFSVEQQQQQTL